MTKESSSINYYIDPNEMRKEFDECLKKGVCSRKLMNMFVKIAEGFSVKFMYLNSVDKRACINFAITEAWRKWNKFDPSRSDNIFALFTTMISNDMRQHYKQITKNYPRSISIESILSSSKNK